MTFLILDNKMRTQLDSYLIVTEYFFYHLKMYMNSQSDYLYYHVFE